MKIGSMHTKGALYPLATPAASLFVREAVGGVERHLFTFWEGMFLGWPCTCDSPASVYPVLELEVYFAVPGEFV